MYEHEYRNDPTFRAIVDMLYHAFRDGTYTPTDVRQATVLASVKFELERTDRPFMRTTPPGD